MSEPIAVVVRIAATPWQAKILAARLQAEGIPAQVEGDSLADEVAVSRRLMNLGGTRILVPSASLQRAREILDAAGVDDGELAAQAMAAEHAEQAPPPRPAPAAAQKTPWLSLGSMGLAVLFFALWLGKIDAEASARSMFVRYETIPSGVREIRRADGFVLSEWRDKDGDGHSEEGQLFCRGGTSTARDEDRDMHFESFLERRGDLLYEWLDTNSDGALDRCRVTDGAGKLLQELRYGDAGFTLQPK